MQAKQTGAHRLELEDGVHRLMVKIFFRSFQPCWHESHADSANPSLIGLPSPMLVPTFGMGMTVNSNISRQSRRFNALVHRQRYNKAKSRRFLQQKDDRDEDWYWCAGEPSPRGAMQL